MYVGKHQVGITKKSGREYIQIRIALLFVAQLVLYVTDTFGGYGFSW